jgi:hypothetical protein
MSRCWMRLFYPKNEQCCLPLGHVEAHKSKHYRWTAIEGPNYDPCAPYKARRWKAVFVR